MPLSRTALIDDAASLADDAGFDAVTLSAVARRLGVRTPSLYSHVRDLDTLLDGVAVLALSELAARLGPALAGQSGRAALAAYADVQRVYAREAPGRWQSLQRRVGPVVVQSTAARAVAVLAGAVPQGYDLPASEHVHAVRFVGSTVNGFLHLEAVGSFDHSPPPPEESWGRTLAVLDAALSAWPR